MSSTENPAPAYQRIVLKLSGEVLKGDEDVIDAEVASVIAAEVAEVVSMGIQVAIVIGGGNIWRGAVKAHAGMERSTADYMGMLATIINGLGLSDALGKQGVQTRVMTAIDVRSVAEPFIRLRALRHMDKGRAVIFVAGTGNPFFSTDTAAALRASEVKADVILKATKVDGVYDSDPNKNPDAKRYEKLNYLKALKDQLKVMDSAAFALCMENQIPIVVFDVFKPGNLKRVVLGESVGTLVADV